MIFEQRYKTINEEVENKKMVYKILRKQNLALEKMK